MPNFPGAHKVQFPGPGSGLYPPAAHGWQSLSFTGFSGPKNPFLHWQKSRMSPSVSAFRGHGRHSLSPISLLYVLVAHGVQSVPRSAVRF